MENPRVQSAEEITQHLIDWTTLNWLVRLYEITRGKKFYLHTIPPEYYQELGCACASEMGRFLRIRADENRYLRSEFKRPSFYKYEWIRPPQYTDLR